MLTSIICKSRVSVHDGLYDLAWQHLTRNEQSPPLLELTFLMPTELEALICSYYLGLNNKLKEALTNAYPNHS